MDGYRLTRQLCLSQPAGHSSYRAGAPATAQIRERRKPAGRARSAGKFDRHALLGFWERFTGMAYVSGKDIEQRVMTEIAA